MGELSEKEAANAMSATEIHAIEARTKATRPNAIELRKGPASGATSVRDMSFAAKLREGRLSRRKR